MMTLIDGDRIVTAHLYDDEYEEILEMKMSIIDYINDYTDEGVTTADDVLGKIRTEIEEQVLGSLSDDVDDWFTAEKVNECLEIIDKYRAESKEMVESEE